MKTLLTVIYNLIAEMHPAVKALIGIGSLLLAVNDYVNSLWADLFSRVDSIVAGTFPGADFSPCGFINYVVPLDTVLSFITAYAGLRVTCASIRIVKSFIPTIS